MVYTGAYANSQGHDKADARRKASRALDNMTEQTLGVVKDVVEPIAKAEAQRIKEKPAVQAQDTRGQGTVV